MGESSFQGNFCFKFVELDFHDGSKYVIHLRYVILKSKVLLWESENEALLCVCRRLITFDSKIANLQLTLDHKFHLKIQHLDDQKWLSCELMLESPCKHRKWHSFGSFVFCTCSLNDHFEWCSCYILSNG